MLCIVKTLRVKEQSRHVYYFYSFMSHIMSFLTHLIDMFSWLNKVDQIVSQGEKARSRQGQALLLLLRALPRPSYLNVYPPCLVHLLTRGLHPGAWREDREILYFLTLEMQWILWPEETAPETLYRPSRAFQQCQKLTRMRRPCAVMLPPFSLPLTGQDFLASTSGIRLQVSHLPHPSKVLT